MNCLVKTCNIISVSAVLHFKDVGYIFIRHLSQHRTIRRIYIKSLPPFSTSLLLFFPGGKHQSVFLNAKRACHTICNMRISQSKNIGLIELFNCPLNPAEHPCCCLMVYVCVRACVFSLYMHVWVCWDVNFSTFEWRE